MSTPLYAVDDDGLRPPEDVPLPGERQPADPPPWPDPPSRAAFHGVAGALVDAVADHTEADPMAILGSILAVFGTLAGPNKALYQGSHQAPNLNLALVGDSSTGRKGTSLSIVREIFTTAWPEWESVIVSGLGSGEGLIGHLTRSAAKDVPEYRALVLETEFGRLLGTMARDGSTLSPTLRNAWDGVPIGRFLAREESLVLRHHVGVLAHVTPSELRERLTSTDAANGFGNRFLWLAVRRTRLVPRPISPRPLVAPFIEALHRAIAEAQTVEELTFTAPAIARWEAFYAATADRVQYGLSGALTARGEAQVARLALVYALLDRSTDVDLVHLEAAEALWDYASRSVMAIFGDSTGNPLADFIRRHLTEGPATRDQIRAETGVREATRLSAAIDLLVDLGMVTVSKGSGGRGRRPDVIELAAFPAFPTASPAHEGGQNDARPIRGNAGNRYSADMREGSRAPMQEMQEMQESRPSPVEGPDDEVDPAEVERAILEVFPIVEPAPSETVECSDYSAHQRHHERRGSGWICTICQAEAEAFL